MKIEYKELRTQLLSNSDIVFLKRENLWFFLSSKRKSRYFGGFFKKNKKVYRFLDDLSFPQEIKKIQILDESKIILDLGNNKCQINIDNNFLNIIFLKKEKLEITFDVKEIFDNDPFKRKIYIRKLNPSTFLIKEYLGNQNILNIIVKIDGQVKEFNFWQEKFYDFDKSRNSPPYNWWVYKGLEIYAKKIKIKILNEKDNQIEKQGLKEKTEIYLTSNKPLVNFILKRIYNLQIDNYLPAGFPWFFEHWYRDELLSLKLIKKIIPKNFFQDKINFYIKNLDFLFLFNKEDNFTLAADTLPLLIVILDKNTLISNFDILEKYLNMWRKNFIKNKKFYFPPYSSWMDTLERQEPIEILSLYFKALTKFSKIDKNYEKLASETKKILKNIINLSDPNINLILVYLFSKSLFTNQEWEILFDKLIKTHYLKWGGVSSLNINSEIFQQEDKGEINIAYHQGDSWYYLNNLFAYCLLKINPKKFKNIIKKIILASLNDLLKDGALGYSSEISSAKERRSEGALVQLWSMSSLSFLLSFFQNIDILLKS
jgi:hypothetical protein